MKQREYVIILMYAFTKINERVSLLQESFQ